MLNKMRKCWTRWENVITPAISTCAISYGNWQDERTCAQQISHMLWDVSRMSHTPGWSSVDKPRPQEWQDWNRYIRCILRPTHCFFVWNLKLCVDQFTILFNESGVSMCEIPKFRDAKCEKMNDLIIRRIISGFGFSHSYHTWWRTTHGSFLWVSSPQFFEWINPTKIPCKSLGWTNPQKRAVGCSPPSTFCIIYKGLTLTSLKWCHSLGPNVFPN